MQTCLQIAEVHPVLSKDSESRAQCKLVCKLPRCILSYLASELRSVADEFTLKGYPKRNEMAITFRIVSKNRRSISKISEFNGIFASQNQREIPFNKGAQFRIVSKRVDKSGVIFDLEDIWNKK